MCRQQDTHTLYGSMWDRFRISTTQEAIRLARTKHAELIGWSPTSRHLVTVRWRERISQTMTHLPDDHEQIDAHHSLQGRLRVEPAHVGPAGGGELQHGPFDLPCGGVAVPGWEAQEKDYKDLQIDLQQVLCWYSRQSRMKVMPPHSLFTSTPPWWTCEVRFQNNNLCVLRRYLKCSAWVE